jgi:feruloyl esterase
MPSAAPRDPSAIGRTTRFAAAIAVTAFGLPAAAVASCEDLSQLSIPNTRITSAQLIAAGQSSTQIFSGLPSFCRIVGTVNTSISTRIRFEVWLPASHWNGNFLVNGFAFFGGTMDPELLSDAVRRGYATATTDLGGDGTPSAKYLLGHPDRLVDWNERGWHATTRTAKTLISAFYHRRPARSYWQSCGGGTRQGLKEIATYPDDLDALAAGGLSNGTTFFTFGQFWRWQAVNGEGGSPIPSAKLTLLHEAALRACAAGGRVVNGVITDPEHCRVDPSILQCQGNDAANCLTAAEVTTAHKLYGPVTDPSTRQVISGPLMPGSELAWETERKPLGSFPQDFFRYLVFQDPDWDYVHRPIDYDADFTLANRPELATISAMEVDLRRFLSRGGKLLIYAGWNDTAIPPYDRIDYYRRLVATTGKTLTHTGVRLFMIPDMGHCPVGSAAKDGYTVDSLPLITAWRERHVSPEQLIVIHKAQGNEDRSMLVCPYPKRAIYIGPGSPTMAENFRCNPPD